MIRRMLIVDDEETIRWALCELFMQEGWEVHCAADGNEAARMVSEMVYDYLITDLKMPGRSGVEVVRQARLDNPELGVTVLTGYAAVETAIEAVRLQAWDYVVKPCTVSALKRRVDEFFSSRHRQGGRLPAREPLSESDAVQFLEGDGTTLASIVPFRPEEDGWRLFTRLRAVARDLGLGHERTEEFVQSCVEAAATLEGADGAAASRAGLFKGHLIVMFSGPPGAVRISEATWRMMREYLKVRTALVETADRCALVLSEGI